MLAGANENRWSDLLASLIATDPAPLQRLIGIEFDTVRREVVAPSLVARRTDRLDLLLLRDGDAVGVIEAKLFSDLGPSQLDRYLAAFPGAEHYRVLHLARLPVNLGEARPWSSLTWEDVLTAYARSQHAWVRATASTWISCLDDLVPNVDANTVWNDVPDDAAGMELALRARVAWLSSQLDGWCDLDHDLVQSSGGGNWAVRIWCQATSPNHFLTVELQEGLTAYEWKPNPERPYRERLPGPVLLLGLRQEPVDTSADFDWALLRRVFATHVVDAEGAPRDDRNWQLTPARPTDAVDKQNWRDMVTAGAPRWLGKGWGMKVAKGTGACLFGARYGLSPTSTLGEIDEELRKIALVVVEMGESSA